MLQQFGIGVATLLMVISVPVGAAEKDTTYDIVSVEQLQELTGADTSLLLIDVRSPQKYAEGHIPEAINIPVDSMATTQLLPQDKDRTLVFYCSGHT